MYKAWEEAGRFPDVVIEITSKSTQTEDTERKFQLYRDTFQVPEYFLYDPTGDYLHPSLIAYRLVDGEYIRITPEAGGRLHSEQLNIDLKEEAGRLRLFVPNGRQPLETYAEARDRADAEAHRADSAEARLAQALAELEALRKQSGT